MDPKYCDVIVKRFEKFTGQKAVRINVDDHVGEPVGCGS